MLTTSLIKQTAAMSKQLLISKQLLMSKQTPLKKYSVMEFPIKLVGKARRVDEDMRNTIVNEHKVNGLSQEKIADMVGTSISTVGTILKKHTLSTGIPHKTHKKGKRVDEDMRNTIVHEHKVNGLSQEKIAAMVGVCQKTVGTILKKHTLSTGIPHKTCKVGKPVDEDMRNTVIHKHKVNGLSQKKIAAMVGTSQNTVCIILKRFRENGTLESIKNKESVCISTKEDDLENLKEEPQTTPDNEEIKHEQDQSMYQAHLLQADETN